MTAQAKIALEAAEIAKAEIARLRQKGGKTDPRFALVDDAFAEASLVVKRLKDFVESLEK